MLGSGLERKKSFLQLIEREWPREWGRGAPAASQPAGAWLQLWASQGELVSSVHTLHWSSAESLVLSMRHGLAQLPEAQLAALKAAAPRPHERDVHPALLDAACARGARLRTGAEVVGIETEPADEGAPSIDASVKGQVKDGLLSLFLLVPALLPAQLAGRDRFSRVEVADAHHGAHRAVNRPGLPATTGGRDRRAVLHRG